MSGKNTLVISNFWIVFLLCLSLVLLSTLPVQACSVPVFKYALAYWSADPYELIVFYDAPFSPEERALVDKLQRASWDTEFRANVNLETVDLSKPTDTVMQKLWDSQTGAETPWMVVRYPKFTAISADVWTGKFAADNVEALLDSPVRKEITRRVLEGDAAVWVLLESGDKQQDDAVASLLESDLKKMSENLKIVMPEVSADQLPDIDLNVSFSMLRLSRSDPAERMLVQMLLNSEWDLKTISKPMAFPVFGRGRALYSLVGDGIRESNIEMACSFLVGWCSCVVKEQNPGVDLITSVKWDDAISGEIYDEAVALLRVSETGTTEVKNSGGLKRVILIVIAAQVLVVAIIAFAVIWRKRSVNR